MEISLKLRPDVALALQGAGAAEAEELARRAEALGVRLEPVHPGESDPLLAPFFVVQAPDEEAERIRSELAATPGVEAAYIKPAAELP